MITEIQRDRLERQLLEPRRRSAVEDALWDSMKILRIRNYDEIAKGANDAGLIKPLTLTSKNGEAMVLYSSRPDEEFSPYLVSAGLSSKRGYFCNLTAVYFHGLTNQVPTRVYVAEESHRVKDQRKGRLPSISDRAIWEAFLKPHRSSGRRFRYRETEIILTERVDRKRCGVEKVRKKNGILPYGSSVTNLERTLIDAVINPHYNGGILSVAEYFQTAVKRIRSEKLLTVYRNLKLIYPYWQSIGFLCDQAGARNCANALYRSFRIRNRFVLDHRAKDSWLLDEKWAVYYPREMISR